MVNRYNTVSERIKNIYNISMMQRWATRGEGGICMTYLSIGFVKSNRIYNYDNL